jgi:exo-beta-1,3-glucanase (GH17 family)
MDVHFVASNRIPYCNHAEIANCMSAVTLMSLERLSGVCNSFQVFIVIY